MPQMKLLKEPGFIYDLIFIFYLKFNTKLCIDLLEKREQNSERVKHFNDILNRFPDIPEDLFVFFHALENGRCFVSTYYFSPYKELFPTSFNFEFWLKELSDKERLIQNLIRFYFHDLLEEKLEQCTKSNIELFSLIKHSKYSDEEKSRLYEFFISPDPYLQTLQYELMSKELVLTQYYEKNYQKILEVYNQTTFESLSKDVKGLKTLSFIEKNNQEFYLSYCLLDRYLIYFLSIEEGAIYLLGYDYLSVLDFVKGKNKSIDLQNFGNALNEENRIKILELLLERKEATCKDLEKVFNFSGSTAYHHMTLMTRIGMINTRNEGKTIFYSINKQYFDAIIGVLSKFSSKSINKEGKT